VTGREENKLEATDQIRREYPQQSGKSNQVRFCRIEERIYDNSIRVGITLRAPGITRLTELELPGWDRKVFKLL